MADLLKLKPLGVLASIHIVIFGPAGPVLQILISGPFRLGNSYAESG